MKKLVSEINVYRSKITVQKKKFLGPMLFVNKILIEFLAYLILKQSEIKTIFQI